MRYTIVVRFNPTGKIQVNGNEITICLRSKPERGKANKEMIERLASYFEVSKDKVRIISGLTSTKKLVDIIHCAGVEATPHFKKLCDLKFSFVSIPHGSSVRNSPNEYLTDK